MRRHPNLWNQVQQRVGGDCQCIGAAENLRQVCRDLRLADGGRSLLRRRPRRGGHADRHGTRRRREDCKGIQISGGCHARIAQNSSFRPGQSPAMCIARPPERSRPRQNSLAVSSSK